MDVLSNLQYAKGSRKKVKRIGRGQGSGHGGTSTRGHKGYGSRSGSGRKRGFEGGQMPLVRRLPKVGFTNVFRKEYQIINIDDLQKFVEAKKINASNEITPEVLHEVGILSKKNLPLKVLGNGEIKISLKISAHKFSASAVEKITAAGGSAKEIQIAKQVAKKA